MRNVLYHASTLVNAMGLLTFRLCCADRWV